MTFYDALKLTLGFEGGRSNEKADRGGLTMYGVTQGTYDRWRRARGQPLRSVTQIEDLEVEMIYRRQYWEAAHCDELPSVLALCVFDAAVNHGPARAIRLLQQALHTPDDGVFGPQTSDALNGADEQDVVASYLNLRQDFYDDIVEHDPTQAKFAHGWANRILALRLRLIAEGERLA